MQEKFTETDKASEVSLLGYIIADEGPWAEMLKGFRPVSMA